MVSVIVLVVVVRGAVGGTAWGGAAPGRGATQRRITCYNSSKTERDGKQR